MFRNQRIDRYVQMFQAVPGAFVGRENLNGCGQVLLPASVLQDISTLNLVYPLQFQIKSYKGSATHCGVLEFVADEGQVVLPQWMMETLRIEPHEMVTLTTVVLPKASFIKLRPRQTAFTELYDPRAVLETRLQGKFATLSKGDTIAIYYCDECYLLDVTQVKSRNDGDVPAASIIDTEVQVDFDRPLDMPESPVRSAPPQAVAGAGNIVGGFDAAPAISFEPVKTYQPPSLKNSAKPTTAATAATPAFSPFVGGGRSLSGKPVSPAAPPATGASPAPTPVSGGGRTLSGKPAATPAPAKPQEASPPAPEQSAETFKPFAGGGRSLR